MWELLFVPFVACVVLTGIHCYLGIHVVVREVIFVDLALAQIAAMGAAVGTIFGFEPGSSEAYGCSLGFAFLGAATFALGRFRDRRIPQEAIIGIVYAVSNAFAILILSKIAVERDEIENMLVGRLLFVDWPEIAKMVVIYSAVGIVHFAFRRQFFAISFSHEEAARSGLRVRWWDFLFYMTFGLVVTSSVQVAGVLLVFSFLIVPAVCSMMFFSSVSHRLLAGWGFGLLASLGGLAASAAWDLPSGASVVATFGVVLLGCVLVYWVGGIGRKNAAAKP
jgi:zinc/manganese transport system permease protein